MATANITPAAYGSPSNPPRNRYGRAIANMYNDLQDCWPCDDPVGSTSLRNLISGGIALDTFYVPSAASVFPGAPSVFGNDPTGKSVRLYTGSAYHAAAYTMPSTGTLELVVHGIGGVGGAGDASIFGNWNGSGIAWLAALNGASVRFYKDGTFTTYNMITADITPTQHWALSWDGSIERFYINGIQRSTQNVGSPAAGGYIGLGVYSSAAHPITGSFAWLCVYKRALTAGEIASHAALVTQPS